MDISPDVPLWQWEWIILNRTILFTWLVMAILVIGSWIITRRLTSGPKISRGQNLLEVLVMGLRNQIREVSQQEPGPYMPFVGTLFLFIVVSNILSIVPGYYAPTSSISTTAALATCVFVAVPIYGIAHQGLLGYLKQYIQPSVFMLPFNIIGEFSRTLALAVRLYGNIMSGSVIGAILLGFVPLFVPILMQAFGLLTGMIQAYIFAVLAMVYIASATQNNQGPAQQQDADNTDSHTTSTHTPTS
ncbi:ATP synthase subunit a [Gimesia chilikensis]|uniref:ATP synthase subunit a n=1 Tax=Gimesia chilikensis TaxID=2605989 RepID=A0A517WG15_9PLAN|nr:F0F1 ATP synthase subunit A [Gimesia chilikensis]QDU04209.1 ATP synthase subunit a [Gimesia chilikensis]